MKSKLLVCCFPICLDVTSFLLMCVCLGVAAATPFFWLLCEVKSVTANA
ncbi:hypothetical protein JY06_04050 [Neisseria meningitidis]|uniref:Lipoprotein n=1 Tax=Neisseria meningitidis TaxID=487 RepID=A0AB36RTG3_NEIME|nr:hypothetical protein BFO62_06210 [Neisseria meningitidis]AUX06038.1 hypothetical protein BVD88_06215 [Neisseria meningitidis]MCI3199304.1 hypothetical protein [Neisseria meningitidis]OQC75376.1 hypothetical protein BFO77_08610 [Neisseria meningitidis]PBJ88291.1 hypothetical protein CNQ34_10980 [Neisseria meningitidis]